MFHIWRTKSVKYIVWSIPLFNISSSSIFWDLFRRKYSLFTEASFVWLQHCHLVLVVGDGWDTNSTNHRVLPPTATATLGSLGKNHWSSPDKVQTDFKFHNIFTSISPSAWQLFSVYPWRLPRSRWLQPWATWSGHTADPAWAGDRSPCQVPSHLSSSTVLWSLLLPSEN